MTDPLTIALLAPPGLEPVLQAELKALGFTGPNLEDGAVTITGRWEDVWRANLTVRGASRILVRIAKFKAAHLRDLDRQARRIAWREWLSEHAGIRVEATCKQSKIYHSGAAAERVGRAAAAATDGIEDRENGHLVIVRLRKDTCTISLDTSGELLHRRGFKQAVAKAPLRETLAALFLRACDYEGTEPVLDPMCGSGTIPIEAAEIALGLAHGRGRSFAFEAMPCFDRDRWHEMKQDISIRPVSHCFFGHDRNETAIASSRQNAARAGVETVTQFSQIPLSKLERPEGPPGLILINPPYGARIGDPAQLRALYRAMGSVFSGRFSGWRLGLITPDAALAKSTGLNWTDIGPPVPHGSIRVKLYQAKL